MGNHRRSPDYMFLVKVALAVLIAAAILLGYYVFTS